MSQQNSALIEQMNALAREARRLSVIGAALMTVGEKADSAMSRLHIAAEKAGIPCDLSAVSPEEARAARMIAEMAIAEAADILRHPSRKGLWNVQDSYLLQRQGEASRHVVHQILAFAEDRPALLQALSGRFLDVGTGIGAIALEAAARCPALTIDGIDIWEPSLEYARRNVAESPYKDRINILNQDVTELRSTSKYSLIWLPTMFLSHDALRKALASLGQVALPGAYLIFANYTRPADPFDAAFVDLRTFRSGGASLTTDELERLLTEAHFVDVESVPRPMSTFTIARQPEAKETASASLQTS